MSYGLDNVTVRFGSTTALHNIKIPYHVSGHSIYGRSAHRIPAKTVIYQRSGRRFTLSGPGQRRWAAGAQALKHRLFGFGNEAPGLYGVGPFRTLVGRPVDQLNPDPADRTRATLDSAAAYRTVRPSSAFVPGYVTGRLIGVAGAPPAAIAIAVNGRVAGTSPTFRTVSGGPFYYAALVPPASLRAGSNDVRLFAVSGDSASPRLRDLDEQAR